MIHIKLPLIIKRVAPCFLFGSQEIKKKMETARDQLAEALYQKGLALLEIERLKV